MMTRTVRDAFVIECRRGPAVESRHLVDAAVVDADGRLVEAWGEVERPVFARSAIKSIQVLPLFESGAAEHMALSNAEIAIACASHNGQPAHLDCVRNWLNRCGLDEGDLECGGHWPLHEASAHERLREGNTARAIFNNCSGKHAAFLVTAKTLGEPTAGYVEATHPVQRRVAAALGEMTGCDMARAPMAIDGCSIPTFALPLRAIALGAARIADPSGLGPERRKAVQRIAAAIAAEPFMIAGDERSCSAIIRESGGKALAKIGAEGLFFVALPTLGRGLALKVRDGAWRATEVAVTALLARLGVLDAAAQERLSRYLEAPVTNWHGRRVGALRAVFD